jgi:heat shock protein HslJ
VPGLPFALASTLFALLTGCAAMTQDVGAPGLDGTAWMLSTLPGQSLLPGHPATLFFDAGRAQGSDGCNRYGTSYTVDGSKLAVSTQGASTRMACAPDLMRQADAFMAALHAAKGYRVQHGRLELLGEGGALLAGFEPHSQEMAGTSWRVTGINNGKGAVVSVIRGSAVTLDFAAGGLLAGSAGCNRYTARYEAEGRKLTIVAPASTRMMCADAGVMEQEQAFLNVLQSVVTMRVEGDRLELRLATGALGLTLLREGGA